RLAEEVGVLAARHLMLIDLSMRTFDITFKVGVVLPDILPVLTEPLQTFDISPYLSAIAGLGIIQAVGAWLWSQSAQCSECSLHNIHSGFERLGVHHDAIAARVMAMQMRRPIHGSLERTVQSVDR